MRSTLEYIEQNLKANITAGELAARAGYSHWHFCRLFAQATGMPVGGYLQKRRLARALEDIARGGVGIDTALAYGFDTYAGFYKAFTRMYGCSPKQYLALYGPPTQANTEVSFMKTYTKKQLREVLTNWDIPQDLPVGDVLCMDGTKIAHDVWTVGDDYILRTGPREKLADRLRVPRLLAEQGVPMSLPVRTKTGAELLEGKAAFLLTTKLPGETLPKAERFGGARGDYGLKYGRAIAGLHRALAAIEDDILPDETNLLEQIRDWALPKTRKQNIQWRMGLPDSFFENWLREFSSLYEALPKQLIHRDPNPCNILFDGGEVSGFVDFDLSQRNVRLWDPCYCATGLLSEWRGVEDIQAKWPTVLEGILKGYDSVNPLTPEEKSAVFHVICAIQMVFVSYCDGKNDPGMKELARTNRDMLVYIAGMESAIRGLLPR